MDDVLQGKLFYRTSETRTLRLPLGWGLVVGSRRFCANQPTNQPTSPASQPSPSSLASPSPSPWESGWGTQRGPTLIQGWAVRGAWSYSLGASTCDSIDQDGGVRIPGKPRQVWRGPATQRHTPVDPWALVRFAPLSNQGRRPALSGTVAYRPREERGGPIPYRAHGGVGGQAPSGPAARASVDRDHMRHGRKPAGSREGGMGRPPKCPALADRRVY